MPSKPCTSCEKYVSIFANGLCHKCFAAWGAANGVTPEKMPAHCGAPGCEDYASKKGLCERHYRRFLDHGDTDKVRVVSKERKHPEYQNWVYLRSHGKLCDAWQNFWAFVEAIGVRPSPRHWIERKDVAQPYGPDNFFWRAPKLDAEHDMNSREGRRAYQQEIRAVTPQYWVTTNLKRYYGITREQYDDLLAAQGGHCRFCDKTVDIVNGAEQLLAVDHDHDTGEIRGLLCRNHNIGLGYFGDDVKALREAADYLERPRHTGLFVPKFVPRRGSDDVAGDGYCTEPGCSSPSKAKGLCPKHYARLLRNGSPEKKTVAVKLCIAKGCSEKADRQGLCPTHFAHVDHGGELESVTGGDLVKCSQPDCHHLAIARGLCNTHYKRWKRRGSPDIVFDTHSRPKVPAGTA